MEPQADTAAVRLSRRSFGAMAAAYGLGVFNDNFFRQTAMLLLVSAGMPRAQGLLTSVFTLPYLLLAAPAGWLADRLPKRQVIVAAKGLEVAAMVLGAVGLWLGSWPMLVAMVFMMGLHSCIFSPALNGSIPELFSGQVTRANAVLKAVVMSMIVAGMAMAGVVLSTGRFLAGAAVLAVSAAGLWAALQMPQHPAAAPSAPFPWSGPAQTLKTLWRLRTDRLLLLAVCVNALAWSIGALLQPVINVLAKSQFGMGEESGGVLAGVLMAAELAGVAIGSLLAGRLAAGTRWQRLLSPALLTIALALGLLGALPLLPGAWQVPVTFALLLPAGVGGGLIIVGCEAFIQNRPPAAERGSTIAAANFAVFAGICLCGGISALLIWLLRPTSALAAVGGLCLAGCLLLRMLQDQRSRLGDLFWLAAVRVLLSLRYRVRVQGRKDVAQRGRRGILFLANHPALIDPVILYSRLFHTFHFRSLADRGQIDRTLIRRLARRVGVIAIPDPAVDGAAAADEVRGALRHCADLLRHGENLLLYPTGSILRSRYEDLGGAAAADLLLQEVSEARVVLIRTRGLWGSGFGRAAGKAPSVAAVLWRGALGLLASGLVFAPRRRVTVELVEPCDVPPGGDRRALNRYLEAFFNAGAERRTYVPYSRFGGKTRLLSEPAPPRAGAAAAAQDVPPATRQAVMEYLCQTLHIDQVRDSDDLGRDLGMDSLARADLAVWLSQRFGVGALDGDNLQTVADVLLAAWGQGAAAREPAVQAPSAKWFARTLVPTCPHGMAEMTICQAFLHQARRGPSRPSMADAVGPMAGRTRTYRDVVTAVDALRGPLAALAGDRLGILLPASVAANVSYLASLFAGKTPVMANWTLGSTALSAGLAAAGAQTVLTARRLISRLEAQGVALGALRGRLVFLEDLAQDLGLRARLAAGARARFSWKAMERAAAAAPKVAAVLFTSGSEGQPKAVPLTHRNLLTNLENAFTRYIAREDDVVLGMLPPFHAFGLTATMLLATCLGARVVYSPSPTDGATLAKAVETYRATMLITTPTFLRGMLRAAGEPAAPAGAAGPLASIRLIICGAEACTPALAAALARACPEATLLEGYGVTECSPIITFNDQRAPRPGTIGRPLESYEILLRDEQTGEPAAPDSRGELLVRGPCVFDGYLNEDVLPPWVELAGKTWYPTGDIVTADSDGALRFVARRRRFIKRGGEMISLPAIEAVLAERFGDENSDVPTLAVVAREGEGHPQIVLFTTGDFSTQQANTAVREAGLSALYNIQDVVRVQALPLLGTGKTDYRRLEREMCCDEGPTAKLTTEDTENSEKEQKE